MRKGVYFLCLTILAVAAKVEAVDFGVQPRFDTGVVFFEYNQESFAQRATSDPVDPVSSFPTTVKGFELKDTMPFVRGGVTFFVDRLLVDLDVQHAFDGKDKTGFGSSTLLPAISIPNQAGDLLIITDNQIDSDFDRTDYTITVGFAVTEGLVVYAGYKKAKTDFNNDLNGQIIATQASDLSPARFLTGNFASDFDFEFEYAGPFVGAANSWLIEAGFLEGSLSASVGVAFLEGETNIDFKNFVLTNVDQQVISLDAFDVGAALFNSSKLDGDTVGISLGINWSGLTPVDGLSYLLGVNGYRYDFDGDDSPNFTDTLIRLSAGFQYAF